MPEPLTLAGLLIGAGSWAASGVVGNEVLRLFRLWPEAATDPKTGLPRNHDLHHASLASLRGAVQALLLELARRVGLDPTWPNRLFEHSRRAAWLTRPLFADRPTPQQAWVDALREAVAGPDFETFHSQVRIRDSRPDQDTAPAEVWPELDAALADHLVKWARTSVRQGTEPGAFESLVRSGWEVPSETDATRPATLTLARAYAGFLREHLKANPRVFAAFTADTLHEIRSRLDAQGAAATEELKALRDAVARLAENPPAFAAFEAWLTPQLGALNDLLAGVQDQLNRLASGQGELKRQQDEGWWLWSPSAPRSGAGIRPPAARSTNCAPTWNAGRPTRWRHTN